jgi:hypothetical protein
MFPQDLLLRFYVSFTILSLSHVNGSFHLFLFLSFFFAWARVRAHTNFLPNSLYIPNSKFHVIRIKFLDLGICLYKTFTRWIQISFSYILIILLPSNSLPIIFYSHFCIFLYLVCSNAYLVLLLNLFYKHLDCLSA